MRQIISFLLFILPELIFSQVSFEASTDAESVLQGSTFQLSFTLKNAESSGFRPPDFSPFQIVSGPSRSMQTTIINGAMSSSVGFVYVLSCNKVGTFIIPSAGIVVKGKTLQSKPITIKVVKATANTNKGSDVFIKAIIEKPEVYYGEQFTLTYKLYTRVNIENIEYGTKPSRDAFQEESVNLNNSPVQREIYEGREYTTKLLSRSILFPVKTGTITIDPQVFRIAIGDNDPWGMGMSSLFRSQMENVVSNEIKISVNELPKPEPPHFSGAVGEMFIQFSPLNKTYTLNDAIHLGIQIQGDANFNMIKSDFMQLDTSFDLSDSKAGEINKVTDAPKLTKTRKFDYLFVPKATGDFVLKPEFIYFNPSQNKYVTLRDSFAIHIVKGNASIANQEVRDIADLKRNVSLEFQSNSLLKDYRAWLLACIPIGILLIGMFKQNIQNFFARSDQRDQDHDMESINHLDVEFLEKKLLRKFRDKYPVQSAVNALIDVKKQLLSFQSMDEETRNMLDIIQVIETMKYSGTQSQEMLYEIKNRIESLNRE